MALVRHNPVLPPCGRASVLAAEAVIEACLWHVLDTMGQEDAAAALVAAAIDCRSQPEIVRRVWSLASDIAGALTDSSLPVAPIGSGRLQAHDAGGRVGRRVMGLAGAVMSAVEAAAADGSNLANRARRAAVEALAAARRERAGWLAAHPVWADAIHQLDGLAAGQPVESVTSAAAALTRAIQLDAEVEHEPRPLDLTTMRPDQILRRLGACQRAVVWACQFASAEEAWAACDRGEWLRWYLDATRTEVPPELDGASADAIRERFPAPPGLARQEV